MTNGSIGAIVGDIVGSIYEFDNIKTKDFPLFGDMNEFTDDTVMTVGTMQALMDGATEQDFITAYQTLGNKYSSSYGVSFQDWLLEKAPQPYNSWGNGSAMRVSPVAWFYDNLDDVEKAARVSARVSHNHAEGVKGAEATAAAIFMARTGKTKQEIKSYIANKYEYILDFTLDDIRPTYDFDESCAGTVPPAIVAFLESTDFEDAIRNAISIGGDSDTLAAITGSIAGAFYGVPETIHTKALCYLTEGLKSIVKEFYQKTSRKHIQLKQVSLP
ncbi:MAG: ADP-ribosylglycohydrolase family protein [Candidatus Saccharimonadales bacterium]